VLIHPARKNRGRSTPCAFRDTSDPTSQRSSPDSWPRRTADLLACPIEANDQLARHPPRRCRITRRGRRYTRDDRIHRNLQFSIDATRSTRNRHEVAEKGHRRFGPLSRDLPTIVRPDKVKSRTIGNRYAASNSFVIAGPRCVSTPRRPSHSRSRTHPAPCRSKRDAIRALNLRCVQ
jgi:hypothetical protein